MSNYKKKQEKANRIAEFEQQHEKETKRDKEIICSLYDELMLQKQPIDKVKMMWFHAGAVWADQHPVKSTIYKFLAIGAGVGTVIGLVIGIAVML